MSLAGGHLSAAEIAQLGLPGLPASKRGVQMLADRERWTWVRRTGRGGGRAYSLTHLPEQALSALEAKRAASAPANSRCVGRPAGSDFFTRHPEIAEAVEAILSRQSLASSRVLELLAQRFTSLPSGRTLRRFIQSIERDRRAVLASMRDPDLFKSRYRLALGRADGNVTRANEVWELDTTKADVLTKGGRKMILGLIDRYSRRARFMVAESESGQAVRRLLVETIRDWGVMPDCVMTDNGSGYINASIVSALETLGIEHRRCPPGSPEKKPYIERLFGTFTRERAQLLPGFAGHNVAQAQSLRSKAKKDTGRAEIVAMLEPAELQAILDAWVDGVYHQREHSTTRMAPIARWSSSPGVSAKAPSEAVLRIALSKYEGSATVGKQGVRWRRGRYWSPRLVEYVGRNVLIRRDEEDLGALFIFDEDSRFIDTAVNHERAGISEEAFATEARRQQNAFMNSARDEFRRKQRSFGIEEARDSLLRQDAERAGKLAMLPTRRATRETPQMASITAAPPPPPPVQITLDDAMIRATAKRPASVPVADKVAAADRIIAAAAAGGEVDQEELARARLYAGTTEYKAEKLLVGDFVLTPATNHHRRISA